MTQHIGVDIVEIDRIKKACARWGETFLKRVFTPAELNRYQTKYPSLAARFAAKEAVLKALGACDAGISWQDIEVLSEPDGKPKVNLLGKAHAVAHELAITEMEISLSHSRQYAVAFVVGN
ncbi:MAG: holo-ACP synthase [Dehalococcoidales bacterium]|nr:holo-ACP synthase [Dehalococcoidales bacterium]